MADWARSAFMSLKSKRQGTEDDEVDFHFVNKRFKREGDNIQKKKQKKAQGER